MSKKKVLLILLMLFLNISIVKATTIDFEGLGLSHLDNMPVITGGFVFSPGTKAPDPVTYHSHYTDEPMTSSNGTYYLAIDDSFGNSPLDINRVDNAPFSFNSIDIGEFFMPVYPLVSISGYNGINLVIETIITLNMDYSDFETFTFGSEWSNLTSVRIDSLGPQKLGLGSGENGLSLDNFVYNNPIPHVPEPGTMFLLGSLASGLFGYAGLRKRFTK